MNKKSVFNLIAHVFVRQNAVLGLVAETEYRRWAKETIVKFVRRPSLYEEFFGWALYGLVDKSDWLHTPPEGLEIGKGRARRGECWLWSLAEALIDTWEWGVFQSVASDGSWPSSQEKRDAVKSVAVLAVAFATGHDGLPNYRRAYDNFMRLIGYEWQDAIEEMLLGEKLLGFHDFGLEAQ